MKDVLNQIADLRRPQLLSQAARIASKAYRRGTHLPKLLSDGMSQLDTTENTGRTAPSLRDGKLPSPTQALATLLELETQLDTQRRKKSEHYQIGDHINILAAIVGEAALLREAASTAPQPSPTLTPIFRKRGLHRAILRHSQTKVSGIDSFLRTKYASNASEIPGSNVGC